MDNQIVYELSPNEAETVAIGQAAINAELEKLQFFLNHVLRSQALSNKGRFELSGDGKRLVQTA